MRQQGGSNNSRRSLATVPEAERSTALIRFRLLRPFLEHGVPLTHIAAERRLPLRTLRRWVAQYRLHGLTGLVRTPRSDRGLRRSMVPELQQVIEGLALEKPQRSTAAIQREAIRISQEHGWAVPSYSTVYRIVSDLDPALTTLAQKGSTVYREAFDLIYRHQAAGPNEVWQADHSLLPILLLNEVGQPMKPWLTIILDDYSRAVAGYYLGFAVPTAQQTALTLHQAIWRKTDPRWHVCGIPVHFYTDNGTDFTSDHLEQVAADLKMDLVFSWPGHPRGRGKIERFFRTVEQRFLPGLPGFAGKNGVTSGSYLSLAEFDARFRQWLLEDYHERTQGGGALAAPQARWEAGGFLPNLPDSLEQLDLLLTYVAKQRRVQQDGIHFQGQRYFDTNLAAYVGEDVTIRYDPRDLAVIRVFYRDNFLCRAVCAEFAGTQVSLKDVIAARTAQRRRVRQGITERLSALDHLDAVRQPEEQRAIWPKPQTPQLKRYINE
jgi:putative transposase